MKLNVYQGKGLSSSHELTIFLQLYIGHSWKRNTDTYNYISCGQIHTIIFLVDVYACGLKEQRVLIGVHDYIISKSSQQIERCIALV